MTPIASAPLTQSIERLLCDSNLLTDADALEIYPQKLDALARSISTHLKALSDLDAYNRKAAQDADNQKYTSYEDLPPPSPADRKRFYIRLQSLVNEINDGGEEMGHINKASEPNL